MTQTVLGSIVALWRYPVKSMLGEELNAAFAPSSGCVGKNNVVLRPAENDVHRSLYWGHSRNWHMFFVVAEIGNVRLKRCAFAKILRLNFTKIDTPARHCKGGE